EEIRDTLLQISGRLEAGQRGAVVDHLPLTQVNGQEEALAKGVKSTNHRSIYQPVIRTSVMDVLEIFDFPNPSMPTGRRSNTTVAPQALYFLNSPFVQEATHDFGSRMMDKRFGTTGKEVLTSIYRQILSRPPTEEEMALLMPYFKKQFENTTLPSPHDRAKLAQALIASTYFQYLD
ncbi:MAG: DUF1553 domain-containing protein, partial [Verrucomicrobiota bacterium]